MFELQIEGLFYFDDLYYFSLFLILHRQWLIIRRSRRESTSYTPLLTGSQYQLGRGSTFCKQFTLPPTNHNHPSNPLAFVIKTDNEYSLVPIFVVYFNIVQQILVKSWQLSVVVFIEIMFDQRHETARVVSSWKMIRSSRFVKDDVL